MSDVFEAPDAEGPIHRGPPFLLRGAARGVDLLIQVFILDAADVLSDGLPVRRLLTLSPDILGAVDITVGLTALVLYTAAAEAIGGATLGKLLFGMRVVGDDGERLGFGRAVVRNLAFFVDSIMFGLVAYSTMIRSEHAKRLGDHWASSRVVWRGAAPAMKPWLGVPAAIALAVGLVLASYVIA